MELLLHTRVINQKQYCLSGEISEMYAIIKALKEVGVVIPVVFPFYSPAWPVQMLDGYWITCGLSYTESGGDSRCICCCFVPLLEQISAIPGIWYVVHDMANAFFSVPI